MKNALFRGVCTAIVTPFLDGKVNYPMLQQLLRRQVESGIHAVVLSGTTGEASTLTDEEKIQMIHCAKDAVGNRCQIIAGTGSNNTAHAVELSQAAQDAGADALLVVTPYYNKATPEGLYAHYLSIANTVPLPMILYNVPSRTGVDIPVSVYRRLSAVTNIVGVKEASTDITKITKIIGECGESFSVWAGNDDMTVPVLSLGGSGVISVLSNVCPVETATMADAALDGDFDSAAALQIRLQPIVDALFCAINPIPVKCAMQMIGYDCGGCRLPLTSLTKEQRGRLASVLSGYR